MNVPRPPFTKRAPSQPSTGDERRPRASSGAPSDPAADKAVWVELTADEVADTFTGLFETFEEAIGPEWRLEPDKAKRIGERWARLGNRWAQRVESAVVLKALVYCAVLFAVVQLAAMIGARAVRTLRKRKQQQKGAAPPAAATVPGNVVSISEAGGGG